MDDRQIKSARRRMYRAVKSGKLIPAEICNRCGKNPGTGKDGRRLIQGHHHNGYEEKFIFDVEWLCPSCHKLCHGLVNRSKFPNWGSNKGKSLDITEDERIARAERCAKQQPWKHRKVSPFCKKNHDPNWGENNRGERFCRTCANESAKERRRLKFSS